ncbi:hypothetical protein L1987_86321 [Smallanthus sonchifolius]|uniref:Uncharacterized protein n=1 Tax=Smallanthus sonchifolius TaxID=185202 RepID=A0ACB8XZP3_9ASTR|nr:hypothetical protein L1987_86321 [Smallanthus sonchifolius]
MKKIPLIGEVQFGGSRNNGDREVPSIPTDRSNNNGGNGSRRNMEMMISTNSRRWRRRLLDLGGCGGRSQRRKEVIVGFPARWFGGGFFSVAWLWQSSKPKERGIHLHLPSSAPTTPKSKSRRRHLRAEIITSIFYLRLFAEFTVSFTLASSE